MDTMPPTTSHKKLYFLIAALIILVVAAAVLYLLVIKPKFMTKPISNDSFFDSQNAIVVGKVTAVADNTITIENKKGVVRKFSISKAFTLIFTDDKGMPMPSSDLKKLETGKMYSINLANGMEGMLEITSIMPEVTSVPPGEIAPPPPPPSIPPVATPSASVRTSPRPTAAENDSEE